MGKKSQARPGLDGLPAGALKKGKNARQQRKEERIKAGGGKRTRKKRLAAMRKEGKVTSLKRESQATASLKKLREERLNGAPARAARREELKKKGLLYDPNQEDKSATADGEKSHPAPPFHWKVSGKKMVLFCEIILHKIPMQKIVVDPSADRLKLNTLGHSRKFVLDEPYPDGLKCDTDGLAELRPDGVLHVKLRITHMPKAVRDREEQKQVSIAQQRALRFRTNQKGESVVVKGKPVQKPTPSDSPAVEEQKSSSSKKKKKFLTSNEQALRIIDEIGKEEKPKREERTTMEDHHKALKDQRKERRVDKKQKRQSMEEQAVKKLVAAKRKRANDATKDIPAPRGKKSDGTGKRVRFGGSS